MNSFFSLISLLSKLIDLIKWAVTEGTKKLEEHAAEKRQDDVAAAIDQAKSAKTLDEKRKAACAIEKTLNPDSRCDTTDRRE